MGAMARAELGIEMLEKANAGLDPDLMTQAEVGLVGLFDCHLRFA